MGGAHSPGCWAQAQPSLTLPSLPKTVAPARAPFHHLVLGSPVFGPNEFSQASDSWSCEAAAEESPRDRGGVAESLALTHRACAPSRLPDPSGSRETVR
jgi:hypothetical protein